jgi:plasmid maintenance system killer protein
LEVYIDNKELEKLYETGKSKKLKLPAEIIDKFFATIQKIESAETIYDLWKDSSLKFEKYDDHHSVRLSRKYRLEMRVEWLNNDQTVGDFYLFKISLHYGD